MKSPELIGVVLIVVQLDYVAYAQPRVVNGTNAGIGEFPFAISIRIASSGSHNCGGSILNDKWILTAAHCVKGAKPSSLDIQYGVTEISSKGPKLAEISKLIIHENYQPKRSFLNDIALIRVKGVMRLDELAQPVKLPRQGQQTAGKSGAVLVGWGLDSSTGKIQTVLQRVDLMTYSRRECQKRHKNIINPTNICAGVENGGKGQCNGDSGGPLMVNGQQVGIVSWSVKPCALPPYPGVYTQVSSYINWIKNKMSKDV